MFKAENADITAEFNTVCFDLELDQGNVKIDHSKDFEKDSSLFDTEHELIILGAARSSNGRQGVKHLVLIDRRLKQPERELDLLHTLYHTLAQCVVYEMRLLLDNRPLDMAWRDAYSELVAFFGVLTANGPNRLSREEWESFYGYQSRGGASRALRTLRLNRWRHNPEQYEYLYKDLRWILFEALVTHISTIPTLDALLRELIRSNGRCVAEWVPPDSGRPDLHVAAHSRKRRAEEYEQEEDSDSAPVEPDTGADVPERPAKRPRNPYPGAAPMRELGAVVGGVVAAGLAASAVAGAALGPIGALMGGAMALRWAAARRARARREVARAAAAGPGA